MIEIGKEIRDLLLADTDVAAAVTAIVPHYANQQTEIPCIVYRFEDIENFGTNKGDSNLSRANLILTCYVEKYTDVVALARKLNAVIGLYQNKTETAGVRLVRLVSRGETEETPVNGMELPVYSFEMNYRVLFREIS